MAESENENYGGLLVLGCLGAAAGLAIVLAVVAVLLIGVVRLANAPPTPVSAVPAVAPAALAETTAVNRLALVTADGRLETIAPDGSARRVLTADASRRYSFPTWSPDAATIAAIGSGDRAVGVYLFPDQAAATPAVAYEDRQLAPIYLFWSPRGDQLSFIVNRRGGMELRLAPSDGSAESRVVASGAPFYWDWAATGETLLINAGSSTANPRMAYLDAGSGTLADNLARPGLFQSPDISADDALAAYATRQNGANQLIIEQRRTGDQVSIPHNGAVSFAWSPTAEQLAYIAPAAPGRGTFGPLRLAAANGNTRVLESETVFAFFWSPDGRTIAYLTRGLFDNPRLEANSNFTRRARQAQVQNPHSGLIFNLYAVRVEDGDRRLLSAFAPGELFVQQFLPFFDQYARSHTIWSPTADAVALPVVIDGVATIYRFPIDGSLPTPIAPGQIAFWSPR